MASLARGRGKDYWHLWLTTSFPISRGQSRGTVIIIVLNNTHHGLVDDLVMSLFQMLIDILVYSNGPTLLFYSDNTC